jgi:hypothetical protein
VPYFTRQVAPNGSLLIIAFVGVSHARASALIAASQPVPPAVQITGLVDTGASGTCVDPSVLSKLQLSATGTIQVNTPTTGIQPISADQFDVSVVIPSAPGHPPLAHLTIPVMAAELLVAQGFHALIGRDVLRGCMLIYDGVNGLFSLAY